MINWEIESEPRIGGGVIVTGQGVMCGEFFTIKIDDLDCLVESSVRDIAECKSLED